LDFSTSAFLPRAAATTTLPRSQKASRTFSRAGASVAIFSRMMSLAPSSASATEPTPFSAETKGPASTSGAPASRGSRSRSARGRRPRSIACEARVFLAVL
jgi:hypothetical protein